MGFGAYMSIRNRSSRMIRTNISFRDCMYDFGTEGSNLYLFDDQAIAPSNSLPSSGLQYIEARASANCAFTTSAFELKITGLNRDDMRIHFWESGNKYYVKHEPQNALVDIINKDNEAIIEVTLLEPF